MDGLLKLVNGRKTWFGMLVLAALTFVGEIGWAAPGVLDAYAHVAEFLFAGGLLHKIDKRVAEWLKS